MFQRHHKGLNDPFKPQLSSEIPYLSILNREALVGGAGVNLAGKERKGKARREGEKRKRRRAGRGKGGSL